MKGLILSQRPDAERRSRASRGNVVAELLAGSWRSAPPLPVNSEEELAGISTLLMKSGAASLSWNKIRNSELQSTRTGRELRQVYRLQSLQALLHERSLKAIISLLRSYGAEPVVVKGWAIARRYPEPGLRPYSDLDLCVSSDHYANAQKALKSGAVLGCLVDLHMGFGKFYDREADDIFARSRLVRLDDIEARVLSDEDHLRFLCMHLLRHGAARPSWLCDVAVLLEGRDDDFDWDRCLGGSARQADWVACAIGLAHQLLGANIDGTPVGARARRLPEWLVSAVVREWGLPYRMPPPLAFYLRRPKELLRKGVKELAQYWPNPIEATMTLKGPFNDAPRLPFQIGHLISRTASLVAETPKMLRPLKS